MAQLVARVHQFAEVRDWLQFHDPKNLVMALSGEVGELTALFQWLTPEQSRGIMTNPTERSKVEDEVADVLIYLVRLADVLGVDLLGVSQAKVDRNEHRYPVSLARGKATKHDDL